VKLGLLPRTFWQLLTPLDEKSVKARAKSMTGGLEDFGELLDMEAFRTVLTNIDQKAGLIGRIQWWMRMPQMLAAHLRITQILKDHPEVLNQTIEKPIFITGYARSGSTWLQHILTQTYGNAVRYVPFWESLSGGIEPNPQQPGMMMKTAKQILHDMQLFPSIFAMHEVHDLNQPEEENGWTALAFQGGLLSTVEHENSQLDALSVQPSSAHRRFRLLKVMMQIKQWQEGARRWVLKSPEHLLGVHELADNFPDAKVITIDRDNVAVYKSMLVLVHTARSMSSPYVNIEMTKAATDVQICAQHRGLDAIPTTGLDYLSLNHHDVVGKPIETLRQVAELAGLEWNATMQSQAEAAVHAGNLNKKRMGGKIAYQIEAFGLTEDKIRERLRNCKRTLNHEDPLMAKAEKLMVLDDASCFKVNSSIVPGKRHSG
jgi:hypothetical protein